MPTRRTSHQTRGSAFPSTTNPEPPPIAESPIIQVHSGHQKERPKPKNVGGRGFKTGSRNWFSVILLVWLLGIPFRFGLELLFAFANKKYIGNGLYQRTDWEIVEKSDIYVEGFARGIGATVTWTLLCGILAAAYWVYIEFRKPNVSG